MGERVADPDRAATQDVLWLGASAHDGSLRATRGRQRRGTVVTTLDVPAELALADGGSGVPLVVVELRPEQGISFADPQALRTVLDAVAPAGAVQLVAEGAEQTRLLKQLLERWPAGWSLEQFDAQRGALWATVRRGAPDDVVDQASAAEQLWAAVDRMVRELHERDQRAWATAHRLALRDRQLADAVARETESVAREHELLDEITELRRLVRYQRNRVVKAFAVLKRQVRRVARYGVRTLRRLRPSRPEAG